VCDAQAAILNDGFGLTVTVAPNEHGDLLAAERLVISEENRVTLLRNDGLLAVGLDGARAEGLNEVRAFVISQYQDFS
jgi:hypothetical protein